MLFKLKKGKETQWREWSSYLNAHWQEVKETLEQEHVAQELCVLFDGFVLMGMEWFDYPVQSDDRELNVKHRAMVEECLERIGSGEEIYKFTLDRV